MESKIALPRLAQYISEATGKPKRICEEFLKELFRVIADELENGDSVRIKGFGTFKLVDVEARKSVDVSTGEENEIPAHKKVIFVASKEVASKVNAPFEAFEAIEVADEVPTDILTAAEFSENLSTDFEKSEPVPTESEVIKEVVNEYGSKDSEETVETGEPVESEETVESEESEEMEESEVAGESEEEKDSDDEEYVEDDEPRRKSRKFGWGFVVGFITALVVALAALVALFGFDIFKNPSIIFAGGNISISNDKDNGVTNDNLRDATSLTDSLADSINADKISEIESDSESDEVPTQPSDKTVYDTISTTRYLTTMAKEHYGNFNLWPVIYEENKDILGHPDRIRPGTQVVIPSLRKYGIDPNNPEDVSRIKQKGIEIYAKYK